MARQLNIGNPVVEYINIEAATGAFDLIPHLEELNIYENIFSSSLTAHITLNDSVNLPFNLPILGEETINCKIRMEGDEASPKEPRIVKPPSLHIYNLSDRFLRTDNPDSERFSLDLISEQGMSNLHAKVSKAYSGMTADQIVTDIWYRYLDHGGMTLTTEKSERMEQCIIPNWTPFKTFNWLASRASTEISKPICNYVYFETMDHTYFYSLNTLATQVPTLTLMLEASVVDPHKITGLAGGLIKVNEILYLNQFDKIDNLTTGQYASKLITHDILKKQIRQSDYYSYDWDDANHLGPHPPFANSISEVQTGNNPRISYAPPFDINTHIAEGNRLTDFTDSHVAFYPKHDKMYGDNSSMEYDNQVEKWRLQRNAHMSLYKGIKMQVRCGGFHAARVGTTVNLIVPAPQGCIRPEEAYDKALTGRYMITAIRHIIGNEKGEIAYKMDLELVKDGLNVKPVLREPRKKGAEPEESESYHV